MPQAQISASPITGSAEIPFLLNCRPSVIHLRNAGAGPVTVKIRCGTSNIMRDYNTEKVLAAGETAQEAIMEPYQVGSLVVSNNTGSLIAEMTAAGL